MDNSQQEMIGSFINITGVDVDRAKFYLESSGWNLEVAMASFYEGDPDDEMVGGASEQAPQPRVSAPDPTPAPQSQGKKSKNSQPKKSSRFATVSSLQADDSDSDSDESGQAFYAGGSERSGQQVLGPSKKKKNIVEDLFKSAKDHGAEEVSKGESSEPRRERPTFRGSGYRLGDQEDAAPEVIPGAQVPDRPKKVDCVLKLWKDGFSVDDGPLRDFKDPANEEFIASIKKGEVPRELIRLAKGGEVNLNMEDHQQEDYIKPKVTVKAFTGEGHTLGSPAPAVVTSPNVASGSGTSQASPASVPIDESKPTTNLQIRLADGSRLVAKFNNTHRVSDVRNYILTSRPQYTGANFLLQTTFPNKELTDETQTLEDGKLLNAVLVQRLK